MSRQNLPSDIISGMFLLLAFHILFGVAFISFYVLLALLANLVPVPISLSYEVWLLPIIYLGLTQLLYVIPACLYFSRRGQRALVQGLIIGAVLTALLNGGCFLSFY
jgi:hypothetical protein